MHEHLPHTCDDSAWEHSIQNTPRASEPQRLSFFGAAIVPSCSGLLFVEAGPLGAPTLLKPFHVARRVLLTRIALAAWLLRAWKSNTAPHERGGKFRRRGCAANSAPKLFIAIDQHRARTLT